MGTGAQAFDALVLNADWRPISMSPLSLMTWQEAVTALVQGKVDRVASYDRDVQSPSMRIQLPSVVVQRAYHRREEQPACTRYNIFLRDRFTCQYCGETPGVALLTIDHVRPRTRGGCTEWLNVTTACFRCNQLKGSKTVKDAGLRLRNEPTVPSRERLDRVRRRYPSGFLHASWRDYLYWDSTLDP